MKFFVLVLQIILLNTSYVLTKFPSRKKKYNFVLGVYEIAGFNFSLSSIIDGSFSVCMSPNHFYDKPYNLKFKSNKFLRILQIIFFAPIIFGYLINRTERFIYFWDTGFLINVDFRKYEFKFLKSKNKKLICIFLGDDIRSPKKMIEFGNEIGLDTICHYANYNLDENSKEIEIKRESVARICDQYCDLIFSAPSDQNSYLRRKVFFPNYIVDMPQSVSSSKNINIEEIVILHAPTNPFLKGTQIVRSALKKLELEGYSFKYIELTKQSNQIVTNELKRANICLNQFFAYVPSVFGVEAMANKCALLTSADETIEKLLPKGSNDAWLVTKYWEVYEKLKYLLDNQHEIEDYGEKGYNYVKKYFSSSAAKEYYYNIFLDNSIYIKGE
jgi:hypothetical protein